MSAGWLDENVAIVTGGGSGLGLAIVRRFIAEGAKVGVLERAAEKAASLEAEFGDKVLVVTGDVTEYRDNERIVEATCSGFGRLDTFIANAGVFDFHQPLAQMESSTIAPSFDELFSINVKGAILGAKAALPSLVESEGSIIMTVSCSAFYAGGGGVLYTASKHALHGVIRQLAHEFAPKVRVNGVAPGGMPTELSGLAASGTDDLRLGDNPGLADGVSKSSPLGRLHEPDEICGPYVLLASRANGGAMTGVVVNADGGLGVRGLRQVAGGQEL